MSQGNTEHRFYRGKQLQLLVGQFGARQVFGTADLLLTERHIMPGATKSFQLTTNMQRTLILAVGAGDTVALVNGCYGFNKKNHDFIIGYTGQHLDKTTGCYMLGNGYRAYSPELMRFIAPDGASPFGKGGINSYAYCAGDPVNYQDDTGHFPSKTLMQRREGALQAIKNSPALGRYENIAKLSMNHDELRYIKNLEKAEVFINQIKSEHKKFVTALPADQQQKYRTPNGEINYSKLPDVFTEAKFNVLHYKKNKYTNVLELVLPTYGGPPTPARSTASTPSAPVEARDSVRAP